MPNRDSLVLASLGAFGILAVVVSEIVAGSVPEVLAFAVTTVVGAVAGGSYANRGRNVSDE
jgi:hypothetical protein